MKRKRSNRNRNRGGRPRSPTRPSKDEGTEQLQRRRALMSPEDSTLATCPLDALKAREKITADEFAAGEHFRACHHTKFGSPHPKAVDILKASGGEYLGDTTKAETGYLNACDALRAMSRQHLDAIENIIIHERFPQWMFDLNANDRAMERAMEGFDALVKWNRNPSRERKVVDRAA